MRSLLGAAIEEEADVTVVDMEAGLEHLSRSGGTLAYADVLLMVMEPTRKSVLTAARTATLAAELGIPRVYAVGNKAHLPDDEVFLRKVAAEYGLEVLGVVPFSDDVTEADRSGSPLTQKPAEPVRAVLADIVDFLEQLPAEAR